MDIIFSGICGCVCCDRVIILYWHCGGILQSGLLGGNWRCIYALNYYGSINFDENPNITTFLIGVIVCARLACL